MKTYDLRNPFDWQPLSSGEVIEMPSPAGARTVRLKVNGSHPIRVMVSPNPEMTHATLVAFDRGLFEISYSATGTSFLEFVAPDGGMIFVSGQTGTHMVPSSETEKFTSVMPSNRRNSDFDRMMLVMKMNEKRRDEQLSGEIAQMKAKLETAEAERRERAQELEVIENEVEQLAAEPTA